MLIIHHLDAFLKAQEYWIEPQNFDSIFEIIFGLYLLITFIPDVIGYMQLKRFTSTIEVRLLTKDLMTDLMDSLSGDNQQKGINDAFISAYSNFLLGMNLEIISIESKLHAHAKKYLPINISVLVLSILFLIFSANYSVIFLVHKYILTLIILIFLIPFIISIVSSVKKINPHLNKLNNFNTKIRAIDSARKEKDFKKLIRIMGEVN